MKKIEVIIFLLLIVQTVFSQQRIIQGINPMRGRSVDFIFRSMSDIANGKSLGSVPIGYTEIYIYFDTIGDSGNHFLPEITGWELIAYANTATLESDFGSPDINLSEIKLNYTMTRGVGSIPNASSFLSPNPNNIIASGNMGAGASGGVEWMVTISFDCGKDNANGLMGYDSDYYYTDLILFIRPIYA